jgi:hypothetical protein
VVYFKPPSSGYEMASQVVRALNGHDQIKDRIGSLRPGLPPRVGITKVLKNAVIDPVGAISTVIGYSLVPYYRSRLVNADSAKWHTADSSKAIDYEQLKARF